jgi:hypothetical protein
VKRRPLKRCEYGVMFVTCGAPAITVRQRPGRQRPEGEQTWNVCEHHAVILDRLRKNITEHRPLLDRLAREEHAG